MKDIKVLLTTGNSTWGVISKVVGSNVYENVISFNGDENLRDEFIGDNLFDGNGDWKSLFDDIPTTRELTIENDIDINYRYFLNPYDDKMEYLNKDTIIVRYTDNNENFKYIFYAINDVVNVNHNIISYSAEKDIMFTHFDDLNFVNETAILRAHTNRYDGAKFIRKDNYQNESDLLFAEPTQEKDSKTLDKYFDVLNWANNAPTETPIGETVKVIWNVAFLSGTDTEHTLWKIRQKEDLSLANEYIPYEIKIWPEIYTQNEFDGTWNLVVRSYVLEAQNEGGQYIARLTGENSYNNLQDNTRIISIQKLKGISNFIKNIYFTNTDPGTFGNPNADGYFIDLGVILSDSTTTELQYDSTNQCINVKDISILTNLFEDVATYELPTPLLTNYDELRNIENEVKIKLSQFTKYFLESPLIDETKEININLMNDDETSIKINELVSFSHEKVTSFTYPNNLNHNDNLRTRDGLSEIINNELPIVNDAYKNYESEHRVTSKTSYLGRAGERIIGGTITGAIGASIIPGVGTVLGAGAGLLAGVGGSLFNSVDHSREMRDLKKTPDTMKNNSSSFIINDSVMKYKDKSIVKYELPDDYKERVYDYLYAMGYAIRRIDKLDNWLNTRYYFNYIKTGSIFSNIGLKISAKQKQIISDSFENGLTVWYYRDKNTFKGILNYEYENMEMNLLGMKKEG